MFARIKAAGIPIPRLYRALGYAPEMLKAWTDLAWPLRTKAKVSRALRELMIVRVSQMTCNEYEAGVHKVMARVSGIAEGTLEALPSWRGSSEFSDIERLVLQLGEEIVQGPGAEPDTIGRLKDVFSPQELVELILSASFYVCVGKVVASLQIEAEHETTLTLLHEQSPQ